MYEDGTLKFTNEAIKVTNGKNILHEMKKPVHSHPLISIKGFKQKSTILDEAENDNSLRLKHDAEKKVFDETKKVTSIVVVFPGRN